MTTAWLAPVVEHRVAPQIDLVAESLILNVAPKPAPELPPVPEVPSSEVLQPAEPEPPVASAPSTLDEVPAPATMASAPMPAPKDVGPIVGAFDRAVAARPRSTTALVRGAGFSLSKAPTPRGAASEVTQPAGFDRERATRATITMKPPATAVIDTPVEVLFKPAADYTEEARSMRIQGDVVLEVAFGASSEISVVRVVRGLGHGLDEAATRAVMGIRFRPARRGGEPVDVRTLVHVEFRLT